MISFEKLLRWVQLILKEYIRKGKGGAPTVGREHYSVSRYTNLGSLGCFIGIRREHVVCRYAERSMFILHGVTRRYVCVLNGIHETCMGIRTYLTIMCTATTTTPSTTATPNDIDGSLFLFSLSLSSPFPILWGEITLWRYHIGKLATSRITARTDFQQGHRCNESMRHLHVWDIKTLL